MLLKIAGISKSVYYYYIDKKDIDDKNKDIIEKIKEIYYANKGRYGYRRITLYALGVAGTLLVPILIYAIWVNANAMSGAVPKATLGYSIAGIVNGLALIYALLFGLAIVLAFIKLVLHSGGTMPSAAGRP